MASLKNIRPLSQQDIVQGFRAVGLKTGDIALVHSAMRTFGPVDGGAQTVVAALLEILGPTGTLVAPTFTFFHEAEKDPILDPAKDRSEMGAISEAVRLHPDAHRSIAFRHSFAAIGRRARLISEVDPALSPFDLRSAFGVMLGLNTQVVLCGVTYASCTSHHFAEWVCEVPYRHTLVKNIKLRRPDGSVAPLTTIDYQPKPSGTGSYYGTRSPDFNCLGRMLEKQGLVGITAIGNAAVRRFPMRSLVDLAQAEAVKDYNIFRTADGKAHEFTPLDFGKTIWSAQRRDGANRPGRYQWCVMNEEGLFRPSV